MSYLLTTPYNFAVMSQSSSLFSGVIRSRSHSRNVPSNRVTVFAVSRRDVSFAIPGCSKSYRDLLISFVLLLTLALPRAWADQQEADTAVLKQSGAPTDAAGLAGGGDVEVAWQAEELLAWVAGKEAPEAVIGAGSAESRKRCRLAWEAWWKERGDELKLGERGGRPERPSLCLVLQKVP